MTIAGFSPPQPSQLACAQPDEVQRQVIELPPTKSASVIGAAGSGKTSLIVELVSRRVHVDGWSPDDIVVLTPNRLAANRLRDAISWRLSDHDSSSSNTLAMTGPRARTPMSLAFSIAAEHALGGGERPVRLLTGAEQDAMMSELLLGEITDGVSEWPDELHADIRMRRVFRTELRELLGRAVEHGLGPEDLARLGSELEVPAWVASSSFWNRYRQIVAVARPDHFDASELLALASVAIRERRVMPKVKCVILDDAHEATAGVISLLAAFAHRGVPVIALGDPDTATTTFRGAIPEFLGRMATDLGLQVAEVETIVLKTVYRHGSNIRSLVADFSTMGSALAGEQRSARTAVHDESNQSTVSILAESRTSEARAIAGALRREHLSRGIPWGNMVVLVRNGSLVSAYSRALSACEVPTRMLQSETSLRQNSVSRDMVTVVSMGLGLVDMTRDNAAEILVSPFGGLTSLDLRRLRLALRHDALAGGTQIPGGDLVPQALINPGLLSSFDFAPARRASRFAETLRLVREAGATNATIEELLWLVWDRCGLAKQWRDDALGSGIVADEANRNLDAVLALFTAARRFVERAPDAPATQFLSDFGRTDLPEDTLSPQSVMETVLVTTPSGVIGAEFELVVVAALQENVWPNLRPRGTLLHPQRLVRHMRGQDSVTTDSRREVSDDERRMFVMALSRARSKVIVSAHEGEDDLPSPYFFRATKRCVSAHTRESVDSWEPSLRGLVGYLRRVLVSGSNHSDQAAGALARLAHAGVVGAHPKDWLGLEEWSTPLPLVDPTNTQEPEQVLISPSKLDAWETDQLVWFIDSIVSGGTSTASGLGTLLHSAMEEIAPPQVSTGSVSSAEIMSLVDARWAELQAGFEAPWQSEVEHRRAEGLAQAIADYLVDFERAGGVLLRGEGEFAISLDDDGSDPIRVTVRGKIDRVEQRADGSVIVCDLKTGKSSVVVKDLPKNGQLTCYQLAVHIGAVAGVPRDAPSAGAKLLFVAEPTAKKRYTEREQGAGTEEFFEAARARIRDAARGMAGHVFFGRLFESEERGEFASRYEYRIHLVRAVTR